MWEIISVRQGEEQKYLDQGWEPFGVSPHDESYEFYATNQKRSVTEHRTVDYIYLRRKANKDYCNHCEGIRELDTAISKDKDKIIVVCKICKNEIMK